MKEILQDKDIKMKLYEEFEQIICSKFHLTNEIKKDKKEDTNTLINIENTVKKLLRPNLMKKLMRKNFMKK